MEPLSIIELDLQASVNAQLHRTDKFIGVRKGRDVILRRGQPFIVSFTVSGRDLDVDIDLVRLTFSFGPDAKTTKNTKGVVTLSQTETSLGKTWACRLQSQRHGSFDMKVITPPDIPVGIWICQVDTGIKGEKNVATKLGRPVYFLYNPWCKDDQVYMPDEDLLDEYVLNDVGKIWIGAYGSCRGREWVFGQFDKYVLPACMLLLERTKLHPTLRGNPVRVSRAISKLVNANDEDKGVIVGKWREPYSEGTPPTAWTGSVPILRQYVVSGKEVCFGQCWVFAGVLTTVCRALGLPSRVVSNLVSAHDANASLTIDRYYDEDLNPISPNDSTDSIWNFHVWNDVWMARPELPPGYGGWQAVDATPQETSDGFFQCGPTSLRAIKAGEISLPFDGPFLYSTVNADIIRWKEDTESSIGYVKIEANNDQIGRMILTKKPFLFDCSGERDCEEITDQYKHPEGSTGERLVVFNAVAQNPEAKKYYELPSKREADVDFHLVPLERIMIGEDYTITLRMKNKSKEHRKIKALLTSTSVFYTGIPAEDVKNASIDCILQPGSREELITTITADEYLPHLVEYGIMKISTICNVCETNQTWAEEDDFQVLKPTIDIEVLDTVIPNEPCRVRFSFVNPLNISLTDGSYSFEAPGLTKSRKVNIGEVFAWQEATTIYPLTPKEAGKFVLVASFFCKELCDVRGSADIKVKQV